MIVYMWSISCYCLIFVAFIHGKYCQYENVYVLCNKLNKEVERVHWLLYYKEMFILKASAMQIGTDFKAGNRIIIVLLSVWQGIKQIKILWHSGSIPFSLSLI